LRTSIRWLVLALAFSSVSAAAESAKSLYNKGKKAETRQDYIAAYEAYQQAYEKKPSELKYRVAFQRMRFLASATHVNRGQELREAGKLPEAVQEFERAVQADPSNFLAHQELRKTRMMQGQGTTPARDPDPPLSPLSRRVQEAAGPVELAAISQQPITLEIANDSKLVYETIGRLAGINLLFDPDYTSRRISLKLNGVSLQEAFDIVAFHSNTFWRPITTNTIYVAANTKQKRTELEQSVLKTFYLSNISAPTDLQDVSNALRQILELQKVQQVQAQNAIVIRGTPDQVALAEKIIGDLDKAKPEVIVEVAIMQVRRDKLRSLGVRPPTSVSAGIQPPSTTTTTPTDGTGTGTTTGTSNNLTINTLANLTDRDIAVTIPAATVNFLLTDSNSRLIQNPQIRALDGQKASLRIGDRVPIATGSLGNPFGSVGGIGAVSGLVNTQFQYIDVGVNIDITPRVYFGREVGLKLVLDVSSVTGRTNIGGIEQPIISQRKIEHDIRLREGEVNLLGGIFEEQDTKSLEGIPGLAQLPFLKYLFSSERVDRVENEIVFVLTPRVVRGQEISELNQRAIDVGTGTTLDLRRQSRPVTSTTPAVQQPVIPTQATQIQQVPPQGTLPATSSLTQQSSAATATPAATTGGPTLSFDPRTSEQRVGQQFTVNVLGSNLQDVYAAPVQIGYDAKALELVSITSGDLLSKDGQPVALVHRDDAQAGIIQANATRPPNSGGVSGSGTLFTLTFRAKAAGDAQLTIVRPMLRNAAMQPIQVTPSAATVTVR
jgi:general secretion pathway protein D